MQLGNGKRLLLPHFSAMHLHTREKEGDRQSSLPTPCYYLDTSFQVPKPPSQDPYTLLLKLPAQVLLCQLRSAPSLPVGISCLLSTRILQASRLTDYLLPKM